MAKAAHVARGALWNYAAQIATVVVQFGYAGATSRLLAPQEFGAYAAAIGSVQLINVIAPAGIAQVVGRVSDLAPNRLMGLLLYSTGAGLLAGAVTLLTAPLWAVLWGVPEAASVVRVLALSSFLAPLTSLGNGLSLRLGVFKRLAARTVIANSAGMAVGLLAVVLLRDPASLAVSTVSAQLLYAVLVLGSLRARFGGRPDLRQVLVDARYSGLTLVSALLTYSASTVGRLSVSQSLGPGPLGSWNRADAITTNPFYLLGQAISQAVFPEFRHDIEDRTRTARLWSDLLGVLAWVLIPLGVVVSVLAPIATGLLLGPGWETAGAYASALALIGAVQPVVFLLVTGFEALGRFRWVWGGYAVTLAVNAAGALVAATARSVWPVFAGMMLALLGMHAMHLVIADRAGLVSVRRVLTYYVEVLVFSAGLGVVLFTAVHLPVVAGISPVLATAIAVGAVAGIVLAIRYRHGLPPIRLARRYGLLRAGSDETSSMAG